MKREHRDSNFRKELTPPRSEQRGWGYQDLGARKDASQRSDSDLLAGWCFWGRWDETSPRNVKRNWRLETTAVVRMNSHCQMTLQEKWANKKKKTGPFHFLMPPGFPLAPPMDRNQKEFCWQTRKSGFPSSNHRVTKEGRKVGLELTENSFISCLRV